MISKILHWAYYGEVFFSRLQGIAGGNPRINGEYRLLRTLGGRVQLAIDVGANVGDWTERFLKEAPASARVIGLEPDPDNAGGLRKRFQGNTRVEIRECGASDRNGISTFSKGEGEGSGAGFLAHQEGESFLDVKIVTLDSIWEELGQPMIDLIKMDIEGEEISALLGAEKLLSAHKVGTLQIEYNSTWVRSGKTLKDLFKITERHGYSILNATPLGFTRYPSYGEGLDDFRMRNLVITRGEHLKLLSPLAPSGRARVEAIRAQGARTGSEQR